jgi:hypothetical protein
MVALRSTKYRNIALWGRFLSPVGYRFDTYPEFSYSLSTLDFS